MSMKVSKEKLLIENFEKNFKLLQDKNITYELFDFNHNKNLINSIAIKLSLNVVEEFSFFKCELDDNMIQVKVLNK